MPARRNRPHPSARHQCRLGPTSTVHGRCRLLRRPVDHEPVVLTDLADAAAIIFDVLDVGVRDALVLLLDENRAVNGVVIDPPADIDVIIDIARTADPLIRFTHVIVVIREALIVERPASADDLAFYWAVHGAASERDVTLLDIVLANSRKLQSMGFVCDPECAWLPPHEALR